MHFFLIKYFKLSRASERQPTVTAAAARAFFRPQTHQPQSKIQSCSTDRACSQPTAPSLTPLCPPPLSRRQSTQAPFLIPEPTRSTPNQISSSNQTGNAHSFPAWGRPALPTQGVNASLPVCTNEEYLKLLSCLLDFPVGLHQDPCEASARRALQNTTHS